VPFYMFFLYLVVVGMAAGWVAHLILERRRPTNWTVLFLVGIIGSFLVGIVSSLIVDGDLRVHPSGLIGSILGATILLALYNLFMGRPAPSSASHGSGGHQQHHASSGQQHHSSSRKRKRQPGHQGARSSRKHH
jgi:uncharacterized membrane protein YeaQ/YmgE (transglycosylase-associated protein family)